MEESAKKRSIEKSTCPVRSRGSWRPSRWLMKEKERTMSELAYDVNGEPISLPASAQFWKVRRFRNPGMRGAPEIATDRDGAPLLPPIDCSYVEFRELVDAQPGRYRLDPLDERRKVVPNVAAAYVTINEPLRNSSLGGGAADERDLLMREMVRAHVEMVKTMSERFSSMMEAGASLLRAADGAGITSRKPPEPAPEPEEEDEDNDEDEEEEEDQPSDLVQLLKEVMPMIQMYLATKLGGVDFPGAPNVPAPTNATPPSAPSAPPPPTAAPSSAVPPPATATPASSAASRATPARNVDLTPTPAQMSHITAVQAQLTPAERKIAMTVAMRMVPEARAQWFASLCSRSVDEAAALIRSNLPASARQPEPPPTLIGTPTPEATPDASATTATTPPVA
jgi:hypothetical protein